MRLVRETNNSSKSKESNKCNSYAWDLNSSAGYYFEKESLKNRQSETEKEMKQIQKFL